MQEGEMPKLVKLHYFTIMYFTSHSLKIGLNISPCRKSDMFKLKKSRPVYFSTKEKLILILFDRNIYNLSHFQFVQHF